MERKYQGRRSTSRTRDNARQRLRLRAGGSRPAGRHASGGVREPRGPPALLGRPSRTGAEAGRRPPYWRAKPPPGRSAMTQTSTDGGRRRPPLRPRSRPHRRLLAGGQLPLGRPDLPARQPAAAGSGCARSTSSPAARPLGHHPGAQLHLRPPEPGDPQLGPQRHLRHGARARRTRGGRQRLARGHLQRGLPAHHRGRGRAARALPPVLVPRRHPLPRGPRDPRLHPRGRRARLLALPRLRRRLRQPRPAGRLRRRRRRGGDRPAGHGLALEQVPGPRDRRGGAADPAPERLQDRQPHGAGPHPRGGADLAARGLRAQGALGLGRRPGDHAPADGGDPRHGDRRDHRDPEARARERRRHPARAGR